ncbi:hypothetical protein TH24_20600 [Thalassospira xiamenensis]|nr:hypothetical protein TH24_20600 [Thalassospira xiamenensis]
MAKRDRQVDMTGETVSVSELIEDAHYAIKKLERETISLKDHIEQLETSLRDLEVPEIPTDRELRQMTSHEREVLLQARSDREVRLRDLQGSRKRLHFVEDELANWHHRLQSNF